MEQSALIVLIIAIFLLIMIILFRKPIVERIQSGSPVEVSLAPRGGKLYLGVPNKEEGLLQSRRSQELISPGTLQRDSRLAHLTPYPDLLRFQTISFPSIEPLKRYDYLHAPVGSIIIHNIPFFLQPIIVNDGNTYGIVGHHAIDIQPGDGNTETVETIPAEIQNVKGIYFLLSAGHGWRIWEGVQYAGREIGRIELEFADHSRQIKRIVLGKNIREWAFGNNTNLVTEIESGETKPAWVSWDNTHRIDFMPIDIEDGPKYLKNIHIIAKLEFDPSQKPAMRPATIISAITCERQP
jgi:hypothetical protein